MAMSAMPVNMDSCYCLRIRKASTAVAAFYDQMLSPTGLTARQCSLLFNVSLSDRCSLRELADLTELDRSTIARSLKPLFQQGHISDVSPAGARSSQLRLTRSGRKIIEQARPLLAKAQREFSKKLGKDGVEALETVLGVLGTAKNPGWAFRDT